MNIWKALLFSVIFIVLDALFYVVFLSPFGLNYLNYEPRLYSTFEILSKIAFYFLLWFLYLRKRVDFTAENKNINLDHIIFLVLISGGLFLFNRLFFDLYDIFISKEKYVFQPEDFRNFVDQNPFYLKVLSLIASLVIAPVGEELVFRKYMFSKLRLRHGITLALFFSSLCFALIHLPNYRNLVPTFLLGTYCCYVYYLSRNLIYPVILHFLYNAFISLNNRFFIEFKIFIYENRFQAIYFLIEIFALALMIISGYYLEKKLRKTEAKS